MTTKTDQDNDEETMISVANILLVFIETVSYALDRSSAGEI